MHIININNKYDYIEENSLFRKKGRESLLQKLHIQLLPQLVCAGRGVQCGRGGWGRGFVGVGSSCSSCVPKVPVARVWLVVAELPYCLRYG